MAFVNQLIQVKISFIGWKGNASVVWGRATAKYKLIEVSVALLTFGVRVTVRV